MNEEYWLVRSVGVVVSLEVLNSYPMIRMEPRKAILDPASAVMVDHPKALRFCPPHMLDLALDPLFSLSQRARS
jgi:hypothetical protein